MICRDLVVEADAVEGGIENGDRFFFVVAAAVLLALEIGTEPSFETDRCRGRGLDL